ncbi:MAG TPA: outer membrane protein transport protein [Polyangia bacterium]|jgi:long-chain fatty acid transport protein|nr:outer membrane protein transport protein [Polyangia bacterium]
MTRELSMRKVICLLVALAWSPSAHAGGGFELDEQSAAGVGMAGAHAAVADDPAAIYYNPAGLGFQPGFGALVGGNLIIARTQVTPDNLTLWHPAFAPTIYVSQRFGKYIALGFGGFANFGEHFSYPEDWRGRFEGYFIDITTFTLQPTLAIRPFSWLSVGVGIDIMLGSFDTYRVVQLGSAEGNLHAGATATGLGGNVGLLVRLIPHYLNLGFAYRSRIDMDFNGRGAITTPPELQALSPGVQRATVSLPFPHNFQVGAAAFLGQLVLSAQVNVSLWRDLSALTLTLTDPTTNTSTSQAVPLDYHTAWSVRGGAQYGFSRDRLRVRLGAGYDESPAPTATLGPLAPDANRVVVSAGIGLKFEWLSLDLGYLVSFLLKKTSTDPDFIATYQSLGQVISASATIRFERVLQHHRYFQHVEE